jgi:hypothetical protein
MGGANSTLSLHSESHEAGSWKQSHIYILYYGGIYFVLHAAQFYCARFGRVFVYKTDDVLRHENSAENLCMYFHSSAALCVARRNDVIKCFMKLVVFNFYGAIKCFYCLLIASFTTVASMAHSMCVFFLLPFWKYP